MRRSEGPNIESKVQAAFDRYNRAVLSGVEPRVGLFIESLEAEGLSLSIQQPERLEINRADARAAKPERRGAVPVRRPGAAILMRRVTDLS